jgi:hypothetical protein
MQLRLGMQSSMQLRLDMQSSMQLRLDMQSSMQISRHLSRTFSAAQQKAVKIGEDNSTRRSPE